MNVLYITNLPAPYKRRFFELLASPDVNVTVLYERVNATDRDEKWKYDLNTPNYREVFMPGINIGNEDGLCPIVCKYILDSNYNVIIINGYSTPTTVLSILICKLFKKSYFLAIDGILLHDEQTIKNVFKSYLIHSASRCFSPSRAADVFLIEHGAEANSIIRYPFTSVEKKNITAKCLPYEEKRHFKKIIGAQTEFVIISVGQFVFRKGFDILLESLSYLDCNIDTYIIGGEKVLQEYDNIIQNNKLGNVHFLPFQSPESLNNYYKAADLFVLPTREDVWGLVVNEALSNGVPVITSDKCGAGLELIVDDYNGYVVQNSPELISNKIMYLRNNPKLLNELSNNALNSIKDYTLENMASVFRDVIKNCNNMGM